MERKETLSILLIVMLFTSSIFAITFSQGNLVYNQSVSTLKEPSPLIRSILSAPLVIGIGYHEDSQSVNQSKRMEIYDYVTNNPGVHFRGICSALGMPIGVVQYHLHLLTGMGLLDSLREGRYRRYFESRRFNEAEMKIISLLRHATARKILVILLERHFMFHKDLASTIEVTSQALTWHIKRLMEIGFIETETHFDRVRYFINEDYVSPLKQCLKLLDPQVC